ncbi:MAG: HutD family protein [Bacteroidia bacterium]
MQLNLTKKNQLQTNSWSGGTTTQLAIYPKEAVYKNLDFSCRISTATIDVEESSFTKLPNVARVIMVLKGELIIQHKDQYIKKLKKFDTDSFSGNWETTSIGKVTDFNVMTKGSAKADVSGFELLEKSQKEILLDCDVLAIYISIGEISIEKTTLSQGDILLINKEKEGEKVKMQTYKNTDLVIAKIWL